MPELTAEEIAVRITTISWGSGSPKWNFKGYRDTRNPDMERAVKAAIAWWKSNPKFTQGRPMSTRISYGEGQILIPSSWR